MFEQRRDRLLARWIQVVMLAFGWALLGCEPGESKGDESDAATDWDASQVFDGSATEDVVSTDESCREDGECALAGKDFVCVQGECLRCGPSVAHVNYVYDGDTFYLDDGRRIRLLLVNAPEVANTHTGADADCYGNESRDYVRSVLTSGKEVHLEYDVSCLDRFDRLLAWVTVDGMDLNAELLKRGLARVMHVPPNGGSRLTEYRALESTAKEEGVGMWTACED